MRGSDEAMRSYSAGDYEISIEVSADTAHPGRKQVTGLVLGTLDTSMTIALAIPDGVAALSEVALDDAGNFILTDVAPGVYDLLIRPSDDSPGIRIPHLDIVI